VSEGEKDIGVNNILLLNFEIKLYFTIDRIFKYSIGKGII
jgi:hypothetical protein